MKDKNNPLVFDIRDFGASEPSDAESNNKAVEDAVSAARGAAFSIAIGSGQGTGRIVKVNIPSSLKPWVFTRPIFLDGNHVRLSGDNDTGSSILFIGPHNGVMLSIPRVPTRCFSVKEILDSSVGSKTNYVGISTGKDSLIQFQANALQLGQCAFFREDGSTDGQSLDGWRKTSSLTIDAFFGIGHGGRLVDGVGTPIMGLGSGANSPSPWLIRGYDSDKIQFMFRTSDQVGPNSDQYRSFMFNVPDPVGPWRISIQVSLKEGSYRAWVNGASARISSSYNLPSKGDLFFAENFSYPFMVGADGIKSWGTDHGNGIDLIGLKISNAPLYNTISINQERIDGSPLNDRARYFYPERSTIALLPMIGGSEMTRGLVPVFQGEATGVLGLSEGIYMGGTETRLGSIRGGVTDLEIQGWHGGAAVSYGLSQHPVFENLKISGFQHGIATFNTYSTYVASIRNVGIDCHASQVCVESSLVNISNLDCSAGRVTICANNSKVWSDGLRVLQPSRYMLRLASIVPGDYSGGGVFRDTLQDFEGNVPDPEGAVFHAVPSTMYPFVLVVDGLDVGTLGKCPIFDLEDNKSERTKDSVVIGQNIVVAAKNEGPPVRCMGKHWLGSIDMRTLEESEFEVESCLDLVFSKRKDAKIIPAEPDKSDKATFSVSSECKEVRIIIE